MQTFSVDEWQNLASEVIKLDANAMNIMTEKDNIFFLDDHVEVLTHFASFIYF